MKRQGRCARGEAGFGFIELLVTIIIAGIAFAALVPVFVAAQTKGMADQSRSSALSLARDKIERIRQLDYDQINENNLNSATWYNAGFGTSVAVTNGNGVAKPYTIAYSVTFVGGAYDGQHVTSASSGDKSERYKQVQITVYWAGVPQPVKQVVLATSINKQYQGSRIDALVIEGEHGGVDPDDAARLFVTSAPVTFTAYVNDADSIRTSNVTFLVYNFSALVATLVCPSGSSVNGKYQVTWDPGGAAGALDGVYTVKATAKNINGYGANTVTATFSLETGAPPVVTGASAIGHDQAIHLTWPDTTAGDVVEYRVLRMNGPTPTAATPTYPSISSPTYTLPFVQGVTPSLDDTGLTAKGYPNNDPFVSPGDPTYKVYYEIFAVDSVGNVSPTPDTVGAIPHRPNDYVAPNAPPTFTGVVTPSQAPALWVRLTWGAASDPLTPPPDPTTGVQTYRVYRRDVTANGAWTVVGTVSDDHVSTTFSYTDNVGLKPVNQYAYYVTAVDGALNQSAPTATLTFTTPNYQYNHVWIQNASASAGYNITVTDQSGNAVDRWPWPSGSWTTSPISATLPKKPDTRDHVQVYLPVGFTFKVNYQSTKNGVQPWLSKTFIVTTTTTVTISGTVYSQVDIP